ncbi:hypothetical protein HMPREF9964_1258 [Streptococcus dysgalactiae subsp. equisimilis SK1249]|nr:hypothetical protein HMPREF9964_1258 [Streptococcus dysgalactiae subsp. equisimilis SK1249]
MNEMIILRLIQALLVLAMLFIFLLLVRHIRKNKINPFKRFWTGFWIGLVTDALDTLGIGSFATTTTCFKLTKLVTDDRKLPGTMTVGHVLPVLIQSLCFIFVVKVEVLTLVTMAAAAFIGAYFGQNYQELAYSNGSTNTWRSLNFGRTYYDFPYDFSPWR